MRELLEVSIKAAVEAGISILEIYEAPEIDVEIKDDDSPLTAADTASNARIMGYLKQTEFPVISEESKQLAYDIRKSWKTYWIVDPMDGTKEFIKRNGEFTVNIALCSKGKPILGVIYVPVVRHLYYADVSAGKAYKTILDEQHSFKNELFDDKDRIYPSEEDTNNIRVVGSRSHMNEATVDFMNSLKEKYKADEIVSKGSSLKFCLVAEGLADIYPRYAPTMEWDTAAGQAICEAVGLKVISEATKNELEYNKENLLNPYFLVSK